MRQFKAPPSTGNRWMDMLPRPKPSRPPGKARTSPETDSTVLASLMRKDQTTEQLIVSTGFLRNMIRESLIRLRASGKVHNIVPLGRVGIYSAIKKSS